MSRRLLYSSPILIVMVNRYETLRQKWSRSEMAGQHNVGYASNNYSGKDRIKIDGDIPNKTLVAIQID